MSRSIELLAPARNLECGIAAINHGADAVYIGADRFGARAAAGNTIEDIKALCDYAHMFMAKVYVTVNTIIYDNELNDTRDLIIRLYEAGADAILIQDMALLDMDLPPIPLHASTQTDNRTPEKVKWLTAQGFRRVVLARELSAAEISHIHKEVPEAELEVFVHGALCVSYSGQCYASQYCFGRSANRGECAQFCRLKFDLEDSDGNVIERGRHLLSLKDLCQIDRLDTLLESGASSLKIEGRLKDITYVKNVTAAYSRKLNDIIKRNPGLYHRASLGRCTYTFDPNINKTFNRGFTHYFIDGRKPGMCSPLTPKAMGEFVGNVKKINNNSLTVTGTAIFANGDGLCFFDDKNELQGFRVNKVQGNIIFPQKMPNSLRKGKALYRNNDQAFEKLLTNRSAERKIDITMNIAETANGEIALTAITGDFTVTVCEPCCTQTAQKPQDENIACQLTKLGNTPFKCDKINYTQGPISRFIPSSILTRLRRGITEKLMQAIKDATLKERDKISRYQSGNKTDAENKYPDEHPYLYNVSNNLSDRFYRRHGTPTSPAPELSMPDQALLMQCRYCIRHALNMCTRFNKNKAEVDRQLFLRLSDGRRFKLQFDCRRCQMNIIADNT